MLILFTMYKFTKAKDGSEVQASKSRFHIQGVICNEVPHFSIGHLSSKNVIQLRINQKCLLQGHSVPQVSSVQLPAPLNPPLCKWKLCSPPTGKVSLNQ